MIKPSNIIRHEIIGLQCTACPKSTGTAINGIVLDETRNTFTLTTPKGKKTVIKEKYRFNFTIPDGIVKVDGATLVGRPQDRIKKKIEKW
ncbi:MAG: ribonuclease P protein subunit [Candidatus Aenigmatarchaeota archaeon]